MNTTDNQQRNDTAWPDPTRLVPDESRERSESVEATSTPEAVRAAQVARDDKQHAIVRGRGVEWVRPTDLMARSGSRVAGAWIDFQADMARRSRHAAATSARAVAARARRLPPVSAFGRGHADRATTRDAVGIP